MKTIFLLLFFSVEFISASAQDSLPTSTPTHIFWQPGTVISAADYQGVPTDADKKLMTQYGFSASASVGIWAVLDIPKKSKRKKQPEKGYFVAAFEKNTSFTTDQNPREIAIQNIYLDICEMCAREARRELKALQDTMNTDNALSIFFETIKAQMEERKKTFFSLYFFEVIADKKEGSYEKWRKEMDDLLNESKDWATTPNDCQRFITNKPIEKGYVKAKWLVGELGRKQFNSK